jgi:hypothetical protein
MAAFEDTCRAVMLRSEKTVNHFLDSAPGPETWFVMIPGQMQSECQDNRWVYCVSGMQMMQEKQLTGGCAISD